MYVAIDIVVTYYDKFATYMLHICCCNVYVYVHNKEEELTESIIRIAI